MTDVAARLSDHLLTRLRVALSAPARATGVAIYGRGQASASPGAGPGDVRIIPADSWSQLARALRERVVDLVVLEPTPLDPDELIELRDVLAAHAAPLVVYTPITAAAMQVTVELAHHPGVSHVVFLGVDDGPTRLRALVSDLVGSAWASMLAPWVDARLAAVPGGGAPPALRQAVRTLFREPRTVPDVRALAKAAHLSRRSLERWLGRAGLASAKRLLVSVRVERAHHLLTSTKADMAAVARRLGYLSPRQFHGQVRMALGLPPQALRRDGGPGAGAAVVARLTAWLTEPGHDDEGDDGAPDVSGTGVGDAPTDTDLVWPARRSMGS